MCGSSQNGRVHSTIAMPPHYGLRLAVDDRVTVQQAFEKSWKDVDDELGKVAFRSSITKYIGVIDQLNIVLLYRCLLGSGEAAPHLAAEIDNFTNENITVHQSLHDMGIIQLWVFMFEIHDPNPRGS